jgi:hypothetical protein
MMAAFIKAAACMPSPAVTLIANRAATNMITKQTSSQNVRRLDVSVDNPFLVGRLDCLADLDEQIQPFFGAQSVMRSITVISRSWIH